MKYAAIDDETRRLNEALSSTDTKYNTNFAYSHELMWYGLDAVAHAWLIAEAQDTVLDERITRRGFCEKYGIAKGADDFEGLSFPLNAVEPSGIFVPEYAYAGGRGKRVVRLFRADYLNRFLDLPEKNPIKMQAVTMTKFGRILTENFFRDPALMEEGNEFSLNLWDTCVTGFERYANGNAYLHMCAQPEHVTKAGRKLIEYYERVLFSQMR